jgi:hypothetical protein
MTAIKLPTFVKKQPVAMVCALLCSVLGLAIYFRQDSLATAQADLEDKTSRASHLKENVDNANSINKADRLDEQYVAMKQALQAIEARLVRANTIAINKQYFYKIEAETQTKLTGLSQLGAIKSVGTTTYVAVAYSLSVEGTYPKLLDFVRRVENGEHFSRVLSLTLARTGGGENSPGSTATISLNLELELLALP